VASGTLLGAIALQALYVVLVKVPIIDPLILISRHRVGLSPKPVERFVFLVSMLLVPVVAYGTVLKSGRIHVVLSSEFERVVSLAIPVLLSIALFSPFVGFDFSQALLSGRSMPPEHPLRVMGACLLVAGAWYSWVSVRSRGVVTCNRFTASFATGLFVAAMLLQIFAWRLLSDASLTVDATWWNSADAVIYTVGQVVGGKTVLVDMPSQYGLFAEFIAPIFKVVGLSIFSFTALWATLQIASLSAVFFVLQKHVREPALKITVGIALVMVTFETSLWLIGINERYWQYWPIRFVWPALSVLAFYSYTRRKTLPRLLVISAFGAIGSIWNADSGLVIELALAAFIVGKLVLLTIEHNTASTPERRDLMRAVVLHVVMLALAVVGTRAVGQIPPGMVTSNSPI